MQLSTTLEYPIPSTSPKSLLFIPKTQNFRTLPNFPPRNGLCAPKMASFPGLSVRCRAAGGATESRSEYRTLVEFLGKAGIGVGDDVVLLFDHIQYACKRIASLVASPLNSSLGKQASLVGGVGGESGRDAPKPLDIVSVSEVVRLNLCFFFFVVGCSLCVLS